MQSQLKQQPIIALFGQKYGTQIINWLNPCSPTFCEAVNACNAPSPFNIGVNLECSGKGEMLVTINTTYNVSIAGITTLQYLASSTDPSISPSTVNDNFSVVILPSIVAGTTYTTSFSAGSGNNSTRYIIAVDSHSNYSNVVEVVIPSC